MFETDKHTVLLDFKLQCWGGAFGHENDVRIINEFIKYYAMAKILMIGSHWWMDGCSV